MMRTLIVVALCIYSLSASTTDTLFPVPENLKDNIEFWKIIYTKTSLKEGLLHDRDYPLISYGKLFIGELYGKKLDRFTDTYKKEIAQSIKKIRSNDRVTWGPEEKRIAALFKGYPPGVLKDAEDRIRFQVGQRERFLEGLIRSGALLDTIQAILKVYNIPSRLAYLPHVESSFDNSAYSHAGAAGLWQFMPSTGKEYMRINHIVDERRDPVLSTIAAARLLSQNYRTLKSWPLAITAYNYGLTGVYKAVKKIGTYDLGEIMAKHESPTFRFASKNFYSCFIAASEIARNAEKYFGKVNYTRKQGPGSEIELNVQLYTFELSQMLGITELEIAEWNPSILPAVFKKQLPIPQGTKIRINNLQSLEKIENQIVKFFKTFPKSEKRILLSIRSLNQSARKTTAGHTTLADKQNQGAESIYDMNLEWPDKRFVRYFKTNSAPSGLAASTFKIISSHPPVLHSQGKPQPKEVKNENAMRIENDKMNPEMTAYEPDVLTVKNRMVYRITVMVNETMGHYAKWLDVSVSTIALANKKINAGRIFVGEKLVLPGEKEQIKRFTENRMMFHKSHEM